MAKIRIYLNILLTFLALGLVQSCDNEDFFDNAEQSNVRLTLDLGTRAAAEDPLNEYKIENVELFFYKKGASYNTQPSYTLSGITSTNIEFLMPIDRFKELFPTDDDTECDVYVIVNRPTEPVDEDTEKTDNVLPTDKSLNSLRANTILYAPKFKEVYEDPTTNLYSPSKQDNFVMDGFASITRQGQKLEGTINVERVASKISLVIRGISDEVEDEDGVFWEPVISSMRLSMRRASKRTYLGSTPTSYIYTNRDNDRFSLEAISLDAVDGQYTTKIPFYTYPTSWANDENSRTHFILAMQWKKKGSDETQTTYYEVSVNTKGSYTERNRHYRIFQEIKVLGSKEQSTPVVLYPSDYFILDWGYSHSGNASTDTDAELSRIKYLVVDETQIEMDNVSSKQIYFFSSDPVELSDITVKWEYTAQQTSKTITFATKDNVGDPITDENGDKQYVIANNSNVDGVNNRIVQQKNANDNTDYRVFVTIHNADVNDSKDRSYIYIEHRLDNTMDADADYTSYFIDFTVSHIGAEQYNETIKITQHPMIVIKADPNSVPNETGGVYVNKKNSNASYGGVHGLTGNNKNPNRYIISVSALDTGSSYIIGDPRESTVNNLNTKFTDATTMKYTGDTGNRALTYYHPTVETSASEKMISPQFMIASSYGVTNPVDKDNARRRCATYQEDGYPAGRWRLPTQAEIQYIVQLSAWGIIPTLFGTENSYDATKYWSANGAVNVTPATGTVESSSDTSSGPVRCVYDTWYWTDKCSKTTFTWGDKATF